MPTTFKNGKEKFDFGSVTECLSIEVGLPLQKDDEDSFEPLEDFEDIAKWEKFLKFTAKSIGVTYEEIINKNFKNFEDLCNWCTDGNRYYQARNNFHSQIIKFSADWIKYYRRKYPNEFADHSNDDIEFALHEFNEKNFKIFFIWGMDTRSVMEAKEWDDVTIFDSSPVEELIYTFLKREF